MIDTLCKQNEHESIIPIMLDVFYWEFVPEIFYEQNCDVLVRISSSWYISYQCCFTHSGTGV